LIGLANNFASKIIKLSGLFSVSTLASACSSTSTSTSTTIPPIEIFECLSPRSQICTLDYRPVCATRKTDIQCVTTPCPAGELKTYANACSACADGAVADYVEGACKAQK
jgi:hypothetical protein